MTGIFTLEVMHAARGHKYTGSQFRVLLELAESRNRDTGACYPSIPTLAERLGINRSNVLDALAGLEARTDGVGIVRARSSGRANRYLIVFHGATSGENATASDNPQPVAKTPPLHNPQPVAKTPKPVAKTPPNQWRKRHPNPLRNPLEEPARAELLSQHPALIAERHRALLDQLSDGDPGEIVDSPLAIGR